MQKKIILNRCSRDWHLRVSDILNAIARWEQVIQLYRQLGESAQMGRALTEKAQAYSRIGQYRQAIVLLCNANDKGKCAPESALELAVAAKDSIGEVAALGTLGNAYRLVGEYPLAQENLEASLTIAQKLDSPLYQISALNSLGILAGTQAQVNDRKATIAKQSGDLSNEAAASQKKRKNLTSRRSLTCRTA